jgi:hypothetical protein
MSTPTSTTATSTAKVNASEMKQCLAIIEAIKNTPKGQFVQLVTERECPVMKKSGGESFIKRSYMTIRNAIDYANRKGNKDRKDEIQMPKWAHSEEIYGVRVWVNNKTGQVYFPFNLHETAKVKSEYILKGKKVSPDDIVGIYAKDKPNKSKSDFPPFIAPKIATVASFKYVEVK